MSETQLPKDMIYCILFSSVLGKVWGKYFVFTVKIQEKKLSFRFNSLFNFRMKNKNVKNFMEK